MGLKQKIITKLYKPLLEQYLKKDRTFSKFGLKINVPVGVFHPAFFGTTLFMAQFINKLQIKNQTVLEVGCGSGLLSVLATKNGAIVTAIDINPNAIKATTANNLLNNTNVTVVLSNLFQNISQTFDFVLVNPPFFKKNPINHWEFAWLAGQNLEYFHNFFAQLKNVIHLNSNVYMVLAENCDLTEIFSIAQQHNYIFKEIISKKHLCEKQIIYKIKPIEKQ